MIKFIDKINKVGIYISFLDNVKIHNCITYHFYSVFLKQYIDNDPKPTLQILVYIFRVILIKDRMNTHLLIKFYDFIKLTSY